MVNDLRSGRLRTRQPRKEIMDYSTGGDIKCDHLFYVTLSLTRDQTPQKKEQKNEHADSPIMMS